jgi:Zn-dependent protease
MLGIPSTTPYDLRFRFLGIPVRVHPLFWLITALLGHAGSPGVSVREVVIWIGCVFFSILVHEYGHGLMARAFGYQSGIVLYGMGGLCYSEGERQTPWQRLAVLISGPGAGFLLAGIVFVTVLALTLRGVSFGPTGADIVNDLWQINLYWSLINLLPIWPLDGGQITGVVLGMFNRRHGMRWAHVVSLLAAGILALLSYMKRQDMFLALFFGFFALTNYQVLQVMHAQARYGSFEGDEEWWRR